MVFGTIPVEICMPSFKTSNFNKENNETELRLNLDLFDEKREKAELAKQLTNVESLNIIIKGSSSNPSCLMTWFCEKSPHPQRNKMKGSLVLHGKAPTKSSRYPD